MARSPFRNDPGRVRGEKALDEACGDVGLGAMPLSMNNDKKYPSFEVAVETVHAALDAGVTLIDTADIYAPDGEAVGHNEQIIAEAFRTWHGVSSSILVATMGGITLEATARRDGMGRRSICARTWSDLSRSSASTRSRSTTTIVPIALVSTSTS